MLLIVWHSRTGAMQQMAQAMLEGAEAIAEALARDQPQAPRLEIALARADDVDATMLLQARGYLFGAPENLATMSGEMKAFFDRNYYAILDRVAGRPYAIAVSAGSDGAGAAAQMTRICTGWRLQAIAEPLIARFDAQTPEAILAPKKIDAPLKARCRELGGLAAATLSLQA